MRFRLGVVPHRAPLFLGHFVVGCLLFHLVTSSSCFTFLSWLVMSPCYHVLLLHLVALPCYFNLLCCFLVMLCCIALLCHFVASPYFIVLLLCLATSSCCCTLLSCLITSPCCIVLLIHLTKSPFCSSLNTFLVFINHKLPISWFGNGNRAKIIFSWVCMFKTQMSCV
jgi:hypothetical protein